MDFPKVRPLALRKWAHSLRNPSSVLNFDRILSQNLFFYNFCLAWKRFKNARQCKGMQLNAEKWRNCCQLKSIWFRGHWSVSTFESMCPHLNPIRLVLLGSDILSPIDEFCVKSLVDVHASKVRTHEDWFLIAPASFVFWNENWLQKKCCSEKIILSLFKFGRMSY